MKTDSIFTSNNSQSSAVAAFPQDGTIELTRAEAGLLRILTQEAEKVSYRLGEAFFRRVADQYNPGDLGLIETTRRQIQSWFVQLFEKAGAGSAGNDGAEPGEDAPIPVRYALWTMDLVLYYGEETTARAAQAGEARRAFHKRLAQAIDRLRWSEARHELFLTEMMLLD